MYSIEFTKKAKKQFDKLPKKDKIKIVLQLDRIKFDPYKYVRKLKGIEAYKLRVGDYRLILDILDNKLVILVLKLGLRKNIYKKLFK